MTDEEAYRYGKRIADDMVRSGRAIRIGDSGGGYRRSSAGCPKSAKGVWICVIVVVAVIVLLILLSK